MRNLSAVLMAALLIGGMITITPSSVVAHPNEFPPCDFLTGGGFIITRGWVPNPVTPGEVTPLHDPAKANFGAVGGCKHGSPTWGHLNYIDHGNGLHVHWTAITAYLFHHPHEPDPRTGQPHGARLVCGTATTNLFGDVDFVFRADDHSEPGVNDEFIIRLKKNGAIVYTTEPDEDRTLGGTGSGGGNIQLHKPNPSTTGSFGGSCPAF